MRGEFTIHQKGGKGMLDAPYAPVRETPNSRESIEGNGEVTYPVKKKSGAKTQVERIRVLLVDDHKLMREGLRTLINEEKDMSVIAEAKNGEEAVKLAAEVDPDIIVMDLNMPKMNGLKATQKIIVQGTKSKIIGLSIHDEISAKEAMLEAGASVYLTKDEAIETLCAAIRGEFKAK